MPDDAPVQFAADARIDTLPSPSPEPPPPVPDDTPVQFADDARIDTLPLPSPEPPPPVPDDTPVQFAADAWIDTLPPPDLHPEPSLPAPHDTPVQFAAGARTDTLPPPNLQATSPARSDSRTPATARLQFIPPDKNFQTTDCWHNALTQGQPKGDNPLFYREKQNSQQCVRHSTNAFLGGPFLTLEGLINLARGKLIQNQCAEILKDPACYARVYGLDLEEVKQQPWAAARKVVEINGQLGMSALVPEEVAISGGILQHAKNFIDTNRQYFGLPKVEITAFGYRANEQDVLKFVAQRQEQTDRMIVGYGNHYRAFRRSEDGDWFKLDSAESAQQRISPLEFIQRAVESGTGGYGAGDSRFEFLAPVATG